jgi:hypothetical protein
MFTRVALRCACTQSGSPVELVTLHTFSRNDTIWKIKRGAYQNIRLFQYVGPNSDTPLWVSPAPNRCNPPLRSTACRPAACHPASAPPPLFLCPVQRGCGWRILSLLCAMDPCSGGSGHQRHK